MASLKASMLHKNWPWLTLSLLLVAVVYTRVLKSSFVNWDDNVYITGNKLIKDISVRQIPSLFRITFDGHYHPLTLISLGLDYKIAGLKPWFFHLHNVLLHLLNVFLVFILFKSLLKNTVAAGITSLLFALHPMNVEVVAWATSRKDVLFSAYFLLSLFCYRLYVKKNSGLLYLLSLFLFLLSCLAKGQAIVLSFCLLIIDYLLGRRIWSVKVLLEKIPFFLLTLTFTMVAVYAQKQSGYIASNETAFSLPQIIVYPCISFLMYLYKIILPVNLSAYYPYPSEPGQAIPWFYWLAIIPAVAYLWIIFRLIKKHPVAAAGMLFFLMNIFIFLKWIPVSNYIIADRYGYIAGTGFFMIAGHYLSKYVNLKPSSGYILAILIVLVFLYSAMAFHRVQIWNSSLSLLDDILRKHPNVYTALNCRGDFKKEQGNYQGAMKDFNQAITLRHGLARGYANRANLYYLMNMPLNAIADINKALILQPNNEKILNDRGLLLTKFGRIREAMNDFNRSLEINPGFAEVYNNRGMLKAMTGKFDGAEKDFTLALGIDPTLGYVWMNRAHCNNQTGNFRQALEDAGKAIELDADNPKAYYEKGYAWYNLKGFSHAISGFTEAIRKDPGYGEAYLYRGYSNYNAGNFVSAITDLDKALSIVPPNALGFGMRGLAKARTGLKYGACADFNIALSLGLNQIQKEIERYCR